MTLTISNVEFWAPSKLGTASTGVGNTSTGLDKSVGDAYNTISNLHWDGNAAKAARGRMDTEKTRASAVSAALLELQKALNLWVGHLTDNKKAVLDARDAALHPSGDEANPPDAFEVADNGTVTATTRKNYWANTVKLTGSALQDKQLTEDHRAAQHQVTITQALAAAESNAELAIQAVNTAKAKVDAAYNGLGDPATGTSVAAPAPTAPSSVTAPSTDSRPRYQPTSSYQPTSYSNSHHASGTNSYNGGSYSGGGAISSSGDAPLSKPSGNVAQWIAEARQILIAEGYPPDQIDDNAIATIIEHESAGDPNAINNWDSNAAAGHPSKGLMQCIDGTFNRWAVPGHTDIWNPVDNIVAASRYSIATYGSLDKVPGVQAVANNGNYVGY